MNRADEHLRYEELAVGHALSALEPEEQQLFLSHLATCARCERDVEEHRAVLAELAGSVEVVDPPPSLWEGIRAGMVTSPDATSTPADEAGADAGGSVSSLRAGRERRASRTALTARWAPLAAAAAMVVALAAWNLDLRSDRAAELERSERLALAVQELGQPDTQRIPLTSENGSVVAVAVVQDESVSLVVDGLEPNDDETSYVLWTQSPEGELRPVEAFDVTGEVDVVQDLAVEQGTGAVAAFAVSREEGSTPPPQPQGPVVASGLA